MKGKVRKGLEWEDLASLGRSGKAFLLGDPVEVGYAAHSGRTDERPPQLGTEGGRGETGSQKGPWFYLRIK